MVTLVESERWWNFWLRFPTRDKFLIIASDGLWEKLGTQKVMHLSLFTNTVQSSTCRFMLTDFSIQTLRWCNLSVSSCREIKPLTFFVPRTTSRSELCDLCSRSGKQVWIFCFPKYSEKSGLFEGHTQLHYHRPQPEAGGHERCHPPDSSCARQNWIRSGTFSTGHLSRISGGCCEVSWLTNFRDEVTILIYTYWLFQRLSRWHLHPCDLFRPAAIEEWLNSSLCEIHICINYLGMLWRRVGLPPDKRIHLEPS